MWPTGFASSFAGGAGAAPPPPPPPAGTSAAPGGRVSPTPSSASAYHHTPASPTHYPASPAHSGSSYEVQVPAFVRPDLAPEWFSDLVGRRRETVSRGTKLAVAPLGVDAAWQRRVAGAPKMQADMKVPPCSVAAFLQDINFVKGDDKFIIARASLINKIARQYIHYAVVKGDDHEAASIVLAQLIDAALQVSSIETEHPQFRPLAESGHAGIVQFLHILDFLFIDTGDIVNMEWHSPEWRYESAFSFWSRLTSLGASEGHPSGASLDALLSSKFRVAVRSAYRSFPTDSVVKAVHDDFVAGSAAYPNQHAFVEALRSKGIGNDARSAPRREKRGTDAFAAAPGAPPARSATFEQDSGAMAGMTKQLEDMRVSLSGANAATVKLQADFSAAQTTHAQAMAALQRQQAAAATELTQAMAAERARVDAGFNRGGPPAAPPVFTSRDQLSADCPADITLEMVNAALLRPGTAGAAAWHGPRPEVFAAGRVVGLQPCKGGRNPARPDGKVGWGSCAQCDFEAPVGVPPSELKMYTMAELNGNPPAVPKRELNRLKQHERVWHFPFKCIKLKLCIAKHCRATPADSWMMVSITAAAAELAFASGGR